MRMCLLPVAAALFTTLFTTTAAAQIGVYAGFSGGHETSASGALLGPLLGIYAQKSSGPLSIGADARGSFLTHSGTQFYTGAVGPRIAITPPLVRIKPYLEGLVGVGRVSGGNTSTSAHLNYQVLFGIDATIVPRVDWRVIEYDYSALTGTSASASILTTGIVVRLP